MYALEKTCLKHKYHFPCIVHSCHLFLFERLLKQYSKGDDAESLEEFAADLDVKEKPKKYKAWTPADDVYMIKDYPPKEVYDYHIFLHLANYLLKLTHHISQRKIAIDLEVGHTPEHFYEIILLHSEQLLTQMLFFYKYASQVQMENLTS